MAASNSTEPPSNEDKNCTRCGRKTALATKGAPDKRLIDCATSSMSGSQDLLKNSCFKYAYFSEYGLVHHLVLLRFFLGLWIGRLGRVRTLDWQIGGGFSFSYSCTLPLTFPITLPSTWHVAGKRLFKNLHTLVTRWFPLE